MNTTEQPVWLLTGAAGTLGAELCHLLLAQGCECIALDRNERGLNQLHDRLLEAQGKAPALYPLDLAGAGPEDYADLAAVIADRFGRLDGLIHAAAHFSALRPLEHQPADDWFTTLQVGLTGPQLLTQALLPLLRSSASARIVWINNRLCLERPAHWGAYGISQAGRAQLARSLTAELGPRGPRVLDLDPGPFYSSLRGAAWPVDTPADLPSAAQAAALLMAQINHGGCA